MSAGGERKPDDPEHQTPPNPESGSSRQRQAKEEPSHRSSAAAGETDASSGDTEGLPPGQPLPPGAEMLRRARGSSIDSFSDEAADLSLLTAEHFQRDTPIQRLDQQIKIIAVLYDARTGKRLWGAAYNRK